MWWKFNSCRNHEYNFLVLNSNVIQNFKFVWTLKDLNVKNKPAAQTLHNQCNSTNRQKSVVTFKPMQ